MSMKDSKELAASLKTFGEKPESFVFTFDDGTTGRFYIGSEVGTYLRHFRGTLYKKYPSLWKRWLTQEERRKLIQLGCAEQNLASNIIVLKASEVEEIIAGNEEKYKALTVSNETSFSKV